MVTDKGVFDLGLTNSLQEELTKNNVKVTIYSGTVANPTTDNVAEALTLYKENNCQGIMYQIFHDLKLFSQSTRREKTQAEVIIWAFTSPQIYLLNDLLFSFQSGQTKIPVLG